MISGMKSRRNHLSRKIRRRKRSMSPRTAGISSGLTSFTSIYWWRNSYRNPLPFPFSWTTCCRNSKRQRLIPLPISMIFYSKKSFSLRWMTKSSSTLSTTRIWMLMIFRTSMTNFALLMSLKRRFFRILRILRSSIKKDLRWVREISR